MAANVAALLDKAKVVHRLPSDYKLALVMGVSHNSLGSYRAGKTLPDARVIVKICELTGDDPAVILAEVEEQRATTTEARALWHSVAVRLQQAAAAGVFSVAALVAVGVGFPSGEARADTVAAGFKSYTSWNIARRLAELTGPMVRAFLARWCHFWHTRRLCHSTPISAF